MKVSLVLALLALSVGSANGLVARPKALEGTSLVQPDLIQKPQKEADKESEPVEVEPKPEEPSEEKPERSKMVLEPPPMDMDSFVNWLSKQKESAERLQDAYAKQSDVLGDALANVQKLQEQYKEQAEKMAQALPGKQQAEPQPSEKEPEPSTKQLNLTALKTSEKKELYRSIVAERKEKKKNETKEQEASDDEFEFPKSVADAKKSAEKLQGEFEKQATALRDAQKKANKLEQRAKSRAEKMEQALRSYQKGQKPFKNNKEVSKDEVELMDAFSRLVSSWQSSDNQLQQDSVKASYILSDAQATAHQLQNEYRIKAENMEQTLYNLGNQKEAKKSSLIDKPKKEVEEELEPSEEDTEPSDAFSKWMSDAKESAKKLQDEYAKQSSEVSDAQANVEKLQEEYKTQAEIMQQALQSRQSTHEVKKEQYKKQAELMDA